MERKRCAVTFDVLSSPKSDSFTKPIIATIILYFFTYFKGFLEKSFHFYKKLLNITAKRSVQLDKRKERGYNIEENIAMQGNETMARIYLDHAATTPLDNEILEKMLPYFTTEFGNADSPHATGRKAMNAVDFARDTVAELINAKPNEVFFTSGGTEADNWALQGGAYAAKEKGKTHFILSAIEHHAVLGAAE